MVCRVPPVGRERRERRPQLRQKRRELGLARDRKAQPGTQYLSSGRGAAPGSFAKRRGAMDRERCAPRTQKLCRDPKARCAPRITSPKSTIKEHLMKNIGTLKVTTPSEREIVLTRVFNAPRRMVYDALTQPELLNVET